MSVFAGGLNRSTQHFILERKDGVYGDGPSISSRFHCGSENGVVGSLAAGEALKAIGRAFGKPSSSIYFQVAPRGGFVLRHGVARGWHCRSRSARRIRGMPSSAFLADQPCRTELALLSELTRWLIYRKLRHSCPREGNSIGRFFSQDKWSHSHRGDGSHCVEIGRALS
jgi:hypothetical protein